MKFIMPTVEIKGDNSEQYPRIMSRSGELVGVTTSRAVWRFGFLTESDAAKAYGVSTDTFTWVLANRQGKVLSTVEGYAVELPTRFLEVIDG